MTFYVSKILQFEVVLKVEGAKSYFCLSFSIRDLFASLMGREQRVLKNDNNYKTNDGNVQG